MGTSLLDGDKKGWSRSRTHILLFPPGSVVTFTKLIIREELVHYRYIPLTMKYTPAIVKDTLLSPAFGRLFLLLLILFWCLTLYFSGTSERSVNW